MGGKTSPGSMRGASRSPSPRRGSKRNATSPSPAARNPQSTAVASAEPRKLPNVQPSPKWSQSPKSPTPRMKRGQSLALPVRMPKAMGGRRLAYWQLILLLMSSIYAVSAALTLVQEDPYSTLGVAQDATPKQLKRAYKQLALKVHPDKHHGADAADTFRKVKDAYELLSDEKRRAEYDESPMWERFVAPLTDPSAIFASAAFRVPSTAGQLHWSQTITSSFLHFNLVHLAFNCWRLWRYGESVEQKLGQRAFVLTFVVGGAVGNVLFAFVDGSPHVGATASVFALIGAACTCQRRSNQSPCSSVIL